VERLVLRRDRTTVLLYAALAAWGYFNYGFGPVVALLRDEFGISRAMASLHGTAFAAGVVVGGTLAPPLMRRVGRARTMRYAAGASVAAISGFCLAPAYPLTLTFSFLVAACATPGLAGIISGLSSGHGPAAPAAISEANAAACASGALAPALIGATMAAGWTWRPGLAVVVAGFGVIVAVAMAGRVPLPTDDPPEAGVAAQAGDPPEAGVVAQADDPPEAGVVAQAGDPPEAGGPAPRAGQDRLSTTFWLAFTVMALCGSVEMGVNQWAADLLRLRTGLNPAAAASAVSAIVGGMFLGRAAGGRLALRFPPTNLLLGAIAVSLTGFAVFWSATSPVLAIAGLGLCGLGNALHYPLAISIALGGSPGRTDVAAARSSYAMALAFGVGPALLAAAADAAGVRLAFLIVPALLVLAALVVWRIQVVWRIPVAGPAAVVGLGPRPATEPTARRAVEPG
jgi:fucose permease